MNKKYFKIALIFVIIIISILSIYYIVRQSNRKNENIYLRDYGVNEYIPTYISNEDMAKIYLNDYIYNMRYDIEKAYDLLDSDYKELRFKSIDEFTKYVVDLNSVKISLTKYYRTSKKGYLIYYVYDNNGNVFIFKTNGVMQYSVYLDENTVEIG